MSYIAPCGKDSNEIKGKRFEEIVKNRFLLERFKGNIKTILEQFKISEIAVKIDFIIFTKDNNLYYIEAKYRNGERGKGLKKEEATNSLLNYVDMVQKYAKRNKIKKYYFECYTNGIPNPGSACDTWLKARFEDKALHAIHLVEGFEEEVEANLEQNTLEEFFEDG